MDIVKNNINFANKKIKIILIFKVKIKVNLTIMRKSLLLIAALAISTPVFAAAPGQQTKRDARLKAKASVTNKVKQSHKVKDLLKPDGMVASNRFFNATRAEETLNMQWGYCLDPYVAFEFEDNEVNQAIYVSPEFTEMLDGATLKSVLTANPADFSSYNYDNPVKTCKVWVKESLEEDPIAEGEGEMGPFGFDWSTIALTEPYIIEKGKPFYVGISYTLPLNKPNAFGYLTDYDYPEYDKTNMVYSSLEGFDEDWEPIFGTEKKWQNVGFDYGNACIRLDVYGDNLPQNMANIDDFYAPVYIAPGEKVEVMLSVVNKAANAIGDVEVSLQYEGEEAQTVSSVMLSDYDDEWNPIPGEIGYGYTGLVIAEFDSPKTEGNYKYTLKITKINGDVENNFDSETTGYLLCLAEGFHKNVVVEEGTGLWCGYCPAGWVGMEYLKDNFAEDGVIGVALHYDDVMDVLEDGVFSDMAVYYEGVPVCYYNRDFSYVSDPAPEIFEEELPTYVVIPACASIEAILEAIDEKTVKLSTKSDFIFNGEEGEYEIGYTVLEDNVGPYLQTNYFSGEPDDESYGFGSKNDPCLLKFNDVARNCSQPTGIEGSLPAVEKGKSYDYSCDVVLDGVKNVSNCRVVAMVINKKSGFIENATVVNHPSNGGSGVNAIATDKNGSFVRVVKGGILIDGDNSNVNIYSASGMKVARANGFRVNLPSGIYFVTRGSESAKVIVK